MNKNPFDALFDAAGATEKEGTEKYLLLLSPQMIHTLLMNKLVMMILV